MQRFTSYDEVTKVLFTGKTRSTVLLECKKHGDLRVMSKANDESGIT